jgi:ParB family transcriptional regulator, chromosome partitioning protein
MSTITKDAAKRVRKNQPKEEMNVSPASSGQEESTSALRRQHKALKQRYPTAVILFRVGDCYEAFGEDALLLHRILGLRLTNRDASDIRSSQAGFNVSELDGFLARLVKAGHKVAVCDQLEDPPTIREPRAATDADAPALPVQVNHQSTSVASKEGIFERIDPRRIHISPFQHRTVFNPVEMEELCKDIAKNGVHTALIVRKHSAIEGEYELATGERRLRIAQDLALPDVPVCIRELTDRQVKELQWSENFRRVNPNPLDEAGSLSQMLEYQKTPDRLARYIGKPKAYVLTRLRLLDLIPALREMVHAGVFFLQGSLELATLAPDTQQSFYDECCSDWKNRKTFRLPNLSSALIRYRYDLSRAIFDPKDKDLVPESGACTHCPYNSATYRSLFPETEKTSICSRVSCYDSKCAAQRRRKLAETIANYQPTAIVYDELIGKMWQRLLNEIPDLAVLPRYSYYDVYIAEEPSEPYRDDYEYEEDYDGFDEEGYAEALEKYHVEKEQYEQALHNGTLRKGLLLELDGAEPILFDPERHHSNDRRAVTATAAAVQLAIKAGTATPELLRGEMTRIRDRVKRNGELDLEKIQKTVHDRFREKLAGEDAIPETTTEDQTGIRLLVYQALNYSAREDFHEHIPRQGEEPSRLTEWLARLTDAQVAYMTRLALRCHSDSKNPRADTGDALRQMAEGIGVDVGGIRAEQEKIAATRNSKANDRIAGLQKRVEALQAKELPADTASVAA